MKKMFTFLHFGWLVHGSVFYSLCTFFVFVKLFLKKNKPNTTKIKINSCIISHQIKIYRIKNPTSPLLSISILSPEVTTVDSLASIIPNNFLCNLYMLMCLHVYLCLYLWTTCLPVGGSDLVHTSMCVVSPSAHPCHGDGCPCALGYIAVSVCALIL